MGVRRLVKQELRRAADQGTALWAFASAPLLRRADRARLADQECQ